MCGKKKTETEVLTNEKENESLENEKAWKHLTNAIHTNDLICIPIK